MFLLLFRNSLERIQRKLLLSKYTKLLNAENKNLKIYGDTLTLKSPEKITIGNNCRINDHVFIHGGGRVTLADEVTLSAYSKIISFSYNTTDWINNFLVKEHVGTPIFLGYGTWVGAGAIILPGVNVTGQGVIIAAGSVVTTDIKEDFVVVGGIPAKIVKRYKAQDN